MPPNCLHPLEKVHHLNPPNPTPPTPCDLQKDPPPQLYALMASFIPTKPTPKLKLCICWTSWICHKMPITSSSYAYTKTKKTNCFPRAYKKLGLYQMMCVCWKNCREHIQYTHPILTLTNLFASPCLALALAFIGTPLIFQNKHNFAILFKIRICATFNCVKISF